MTAHLYDSCLCPLPPWRALPGPLEMASRFEWHGRPLTGLSVTPTSEDVETAIRPDWGAILSAWHSATGTTGRALTLAGGADDLRRALDALVAGGSRSIVLTGLRDRRRVRDVLEDDGSPVGRGWMFDVGGGSALFEALALGPGVAGIVGVRDPAPFAEAIGRGAIELSTWPARLANCSIWVHLGSAAAGHGRVILHGYCADDRALEVEAALARQVSRGSADDVFDAGRLVERGHVVPGGAGGTLRVRGEGPLSIPGESDIERVEICDASWVDVDSLARLPGLTSLTIGGGGHWWSAAGLTHLESLTAPWPPESGLSSVAALSHLRELSLGTCEGDALREMRGHDLRRLCIDRTDDLPTLMRAIADLRSLEVLELHMPGVTDLQPLAELPRLRALILTGGATDEVDLTPLAGAMTLRRLEIPHHTPASLEPLVSMALDVLSLDGRDVALDPLGHLSRLRTLSLRRAIPPPEVARGLAGVEELRLLDLEGGDPAAVLQMPALARLVITGEHGPIRWPAGLRVIEPREPGPDRRRPR